MSGPIRVSVNVIGDSPIKVDARVPHRTQKIDVKAPIIQGKDTPEYEGPYTVEPTEQIQILDTDGHKMTDDVTVGAVPPDYVGSGVVRRDSSDLIKTGATINVPAGYYDENAAGTIQNATLSPVSVSITPDITVDTNGLVTASKTASTLKTPVSSAGYAKTTDAVQITANVSNTYQLPTKSSSDLTASGKTVTAPAGYYPASATKDVENGVRGNRVNTIGYSGTKKTYKISYPDATSGYYAAAIVKEPGQFELERQQETVTPTESAQEVTPTNSLYYLEKVTVNPIPTDYGKIEQNGSVLTIS